MKKIYKGIREGDSLYWGKPVTVCSDDNIIINLITGDLTITCDHIPEEGKEIKFKVLNWEAMNWYMKIYWKIRLFLRCKIYEKD